MLCTCLNNKNVCLRRGGWRGGGAEGGVGGGLNLGNVFLVVCYCCVVLRKLLLPPASIFKDKKQIKT